MASWAYIMDEAELRAKLKRKGFDLLRREYGTDAGNASFYAGEL